MKKRPPLWKRLVLSTVVGAAVAAAARAVQGRLVAQPQAPAVPAPSKDWPPLPDLAAPTPAPRPSQADGPAPDVRGTTGPAPAPTPAPPPESPVSSVVVTPAAGFEAPAPAPAADVPLPPPDEADTGSDVAPAPAIRVPGDGPGGAVGSIVSEAGSGGAEPVEDEAEGAGDREHLVTDPEPEAVLPDERIDQAGEEQPLIAGGADEVPPAPEPTFGTVPDPEAAAGAPVPVATPVETGPEEELPIPHRAPGGETGPEPVHPNPVTSAGSAPATRTERGSSSAKASKAAPEEPTDDGADGVDPAGG